MVRLLLLVLVADDPYELAKAGRYKEAHEAFKPLVARQPNDAGLRHTAATVAWGAGEHEAARDHWLVVKRLRPNWGVVRANLVKAHQVLGDRAARDRERAGLLALWRSKRDLEFSFMDLYARDEFDGVTVFERLRGGPERLIFSSPKEKIVLLCPPKQKCFLEGNERYAEYPGEPPYDVVRERVRKRFAPAPPAGSSSAARSPARTP